MLSESECTSTTIGKKVLIHCISWNAFGVLKLCTESKFLTRLNPLYIVECFRRGISVFENAKVTS